MPHTIFQHRQRETEALLHSFDWTWESYLWYFNRKEGECWKVILSGNKWGRFHGNTLIPSSQCEKDSRVHGIQKVRLLVSMLMGWMAFLSHHLHFYIICSSPLSLWGLLRWLSGKESTCNAGDLGSIPGSGRSSEKEMATHSSILACKIPRTGAWWVTVHEAAKEVDLT